MKQDLLLPGLLLVDIIVEVWERKLTLGVHILLHVPDEGEEHWQDGFKSATVAVLQQLQTAVYLPLLTTVRHLAFPPIL